MWEISQVSVFLETMRQVAWMLARRMAWLTSGTSFAGAGHAGLLVFLETTGPVAVLTRALASSKFPGPALRAVPSQGPRRASGALAAGAVAAGTRAKVGAQGLLHSRCNTVQL